MTSRHAVQPFLILALVSGCIGLNPCKDYTLLWMENGRRSSDFNSMDTATSICDAYLDENTWFRFQHDAGNRLIEKPAEPWHCGAQAPIWLNGTHPTDTTEITARVCATYSSANNCGWNGTVRIQLCNEAGSKYFVYLLTAPPGCPLAYCVDAASRKKCVYPEVWLEDQLMCGEQLPSTPAPTATSISPTEPPSSGWSRWGPWSDCSKKCDYGQQTSRRTCGKLPCPGAATRLQLCAKSNCKELPTEKEIGRVLILQSADASQDTMLKVVESQQVIDNIFRSNINKICSHDASLCCGFTSKSISLGFVNFFVMSHDIYAATGFPQLKSDGTVQYKIIAKINKVVYQETCSKTRQSRSTDSHFIPSKVMEMAAKNSLSEIQEETDLYVKQDNDGQTCTASTCIVPIVICFVILIVVALIIGIALYKMKKSKKTGKSAYDKDPNKAAPNMVYSYVRSG